MNSRFNENRIFLGIHKLCSLNASYESESSDGSAEGAKQPQSWVLKWKKVSPVRATQTDCVALAGLSLHLVLFPRVPALRAFTLGFAVAHFQRSTY
jgi:hypothetical protein